MDVVIAWQFGASFWGNRDSIPGAFRHKAVPLCNAETAAAERDALRADAEALRADAERYRWLSARFRVFSAHIDGNHHWTPTGDVERITGPSLGAAIDAAIAARAGGGKP